MRTLIDLDTFEDRDVTAVVAELTQQIDTWRGEQARLKDEVRDLNADLVEADVDRLKDGQSSLIDIRLKITSVDNALTEHHKKVEECDANISRLKVQLEKAAGQNQAVSQVRSRILREAKEVFDAAVEHYKSQLRQRVQDTASDLFLKMTTEAEDYAGLQITPTYGLHLLHRDSMVEEGRSAGAEHVIALALMGALQRNAPLRGPIVMDSPFGRLDVGHTANVVAALPAMADQVVLLVHEAELQANKVREILGGDLRAEYELVRVTSRRTRIEQVR